MLANIRNPWIRKPLCVVLWPIFVSGLLVLTIGEWYDREAADDIRAAWRGPVK